jgi:hypothetical protein
LHVSIGFSLGDDAPRVERKQTAVAIAEYLLKLDPPIDQLVEWTPSHRRDPLPHCIRFLRILAVPDPAMAHWTAPQAGWVAPLTEELVQACVDDKVGKLLHYRSVAPTTWLLIAVEGRAPSQFFDRRPNIRSEAIRSPFDATYLLNLIESSVQRLSFAHDA